MHENTNDNRRYLPVYNTMKLNDTDICEIIWIAMEEMNSRRNVKKIHPIPTDTGSLSLSLSLSLSHFQKNSKKFQQPI